MFLNQLNKKNAIFIFYSLFAFFFVSVYAFVPQIVFAGVIDPDFPDGLYCTFEQTDETGPHSWDGIFIYTTKDTGNWLEGFGTSTRLYRWEDGGSNAILVYSDIGEFLYSSNYFGSTNNCEDTSISDLTTLGQTVNFGGGGESGTTTIYASSTVEDQQLLTASIGFWSLLLFFISLAFTVWMWRLFMV